MSKTLVVNLYGGPGTGKSTICAGVFSKLKWAGVNCEMALEYAKGLVWEGSTNKFDNQVYIFSKQFHRIFILLDKVDVVITDCPILMSLVYSEGKENDRLRNLVVDKYKELNNMDIFLKRLKGYNPAGRLQTYEKAKELDDKIQMVLSVHSTEYAVLDGVQETEQKIVNMIIRKIIPNG